MALIEIKYVNKTGNTHEHITHLGNDAGTWKVEDVIKWIESLEHKFFTNVNGKRAEIVVKKGTYRKYVQTVADGVPQNNLLSLPPCKVAAA